jgi:clathrin heavy chain
MHVDAKHGMLYCATKIGYLLVYEISTNVLLSRVRISEKPIFVGTKNSKNDGLYVINALGQTTLCSIDDNNLIKFILSSCPHI